MREGQLWIQAGAKYMAAAGWPTAKTVGPGRGDQASSS